MNYRNFTAIFAGSIHLETERKKSLALAGLPEGHVAATYEKHNGMGLIENR